MFVRAFLEGIFVLALLSALAALFPVRRPSEKKLHGSSD
jgi:hypothetical protein